MRSIFTFLFFVVTVTTLNAQLKVFRKYPFEKGGYAIVGLRAEAKADIFVETLGEFYTDDIEVLNAFKNTWVFTNRSPHQHCGYQYSIQVTHNGVIEEDLLVNLDCKVIATGKGYYYFNPNKLMDIAARLKKPVIRKYAFDSASQGNHFIDSIKQEKNLLLTFEPFWTKYEGSFTFTCQRSGKTNPVILEKKLRSDLKRKYPKDVFVLSFDRTENTGDHIFRLIANRSFFSRFSIYPKSEWKPYVPELTTAWR